MKTINILGTEYRIETHKISLDNTLKNNNFCGYCCSNDPLIVIADYNEEEYFKDFTDKEKETSIKKTLRHEITHAFFNESGLQDSSNQFDGAWAKNEEMVDWIAIQFPKMLKAFEESECL